MKIETTTIVANDGLNYMVPENPLESVILREICEYRLGRTEFPVATHDGKEIGGKLELKSAKAPDAAGVFEFAFRFRPVSGYATANEVMRVAQYLRERVRVMTRTLHHGEPEVKLEFTSVSRSGRFFQQYDEVTVSVSVFPRVQMHTVEQVEQVEQS